MSAFDNETIVSVSECDNELIIKMSNPDKLLDLNPNLDILSKIDYKSFIVTSDTHCQTDVDYDFCVKVFAPKLGIRKAITTPIVYAKLAAYWSSRIGQRELVGSPPKSERVNVRYCSEFTYVTGNCVVSAKGEMFAF